MQEGYKGLLVWQSAMDLVIKTYLLLKLFPKEEMYALANQMRRAAISIPSNIAEGYVRNSTKEYVNFLYIARGSCAELETQVLLAEKLGYLPNGEEQEILELLDKVGRMLYAIIAKLKNSK